MPTAYLIDASPYIFRAYFALPPTIKTPAGTPANAIYGYTEFLLQILKKVSPTHVAVAFDRSLTTSFRNEIYAEYKAQRSLPPPELEQQLDSCFRVTEALGMPALIDDRYESDDIIGTLVEQVLPENFAIVIVSSDKDFGQLVNNRIRFWDFARDEVYDPEKIKQKFGINPEQMVDYLAMVGDSVDNIPGVTGVGPKTAQQLLERFGTLENILSSPEEVVDLPIRAAASVKKKLETQQETAYLSKQLATIVRDVPIDITAETMEYKGADKQRLSRLFEELGFETIMERVPTWRQG